MPSRKTEVSSPPHFPQPNGPTTPAPRRITTYVSAYERTIKKLNAILISFYLPETASTLLCSCQCPTSSSLNPLDATCWHPCSSRSSSSGPSSLSCLNPRASEPLLRETMISPGQSAEGMILLHFPVTKEVWDHRRRAVLNVDLYHQGQQEVLISRASEAVPNATPTPTPSPVSSPTN